MGYYSSFEVVDTEIELDILCERLNSFLEAYDMGCRFEQYGGSIHSNDTWKWYDWVEDLAQYAKQYPNDYFIILREGEESPDMSRVVVKDGNAREQFPNITWPPVDLDPTA